MFKKKRSAPITQVKYKVCGVVMHPVQIERHREWTGYNETEPINEIEKPQKD